MIQFVLGLVLGAALGVFIASLASAARRGDEQSIIARRGYLLEQAKNALNRYGEFRHLGDAITRELDDEAGA